MSIMQCPSGFKSVNCAVTRKTCLIKSNSFFSGQIISSRNTQFVHKRRVPLITRMGFGEDLINSITVFINNSPLADGKKALAIAQAGNYNVEETKQLLNSYISDNPVVVFSWTTCPFCIKAKELLDSTGAKYKAIELNTMPNGNALRAELAKLTNRTSMPNVFISGTSYGGCNDGPGVMTLQKEGRLDGLLRAARAL